jgi:hypothetical protein
MAHRSSRTVRRRRRALALGIAGALVVGGGTFAFLDHGSSPSRAGTGSSSSASSTQTASSAATATATCPLTGQPAPGGAVPQRAALAIKVGNDPGARPQSGLNEADIVYEVQAEGGITRFIAIFQCHAPAEVGPIRSLRWVDWHVLGQFGHPILVYAGGIVPDRQELASQAWLHRVDALDYNGVPFERSTNRVPPENLYGSPSGIWSLVGRTSAPAPVFSFSQRPPAGGTPVSTVNVTFSAEEPVQWTWNAATGLFDRSYAGVPATGASGAPQSATNVIVQFVQSVPGPYNESGPNSLGVHSEVIGSGPVWVLRDGELFRGTWSRATLSAPTLLESASGAVIPLAPGRTWVEVLPQTGQASFASAGGSGG